jgi:hypothetical protein
MDPAPGYDPLMPHDLLHLVVEAQLGLTNGIFGQLAAGGTAGTFHAITDAHVDIRSAARARRRLQKRGKKLLRDGRDDGNLSELATYICWQRWLARSASADRRKTAQTMNDEAIHLRRIASSNEMKGMNEKLDQICQHLDELSAHWSQLAVGESMTVRWPDLVVSSNKSFSATL